MREGSKGVPSKLKRDGVAKQDLGDMRVSEKLASEGALIRREGGG
jgi:hypothetical protein